MADKLKGHLAMLGANTCWGLMAPVAKLVMAGGLVAPLMLAGLRFWGAAALFWITGMFTKKEHVPPRDILLLFGAGMIGVMFNQGLFIVGVGYTSPGEASIITTTMPMWVMLLAALVLKEPITWKKGGGIALGATGAILLITGSGGLGSRGTNAMLGDLMVLTAQLSYAIYLTYYKNFIRKYSLVTLMKWMFLFASLTSLPVMLSEAEQTMWSELPADIWLGVGYVVVAGTFLAYICVMTGQKNLRPTVVGMYNYVQPVVASCVGIALGLDSFTPAKTLAVALIFAGVYLVSVSKSRADVEREKQGAGKCD